MKKNERNKSKELYLLATPVSHRALNQRSVPSKEGSKEAGVRQILEGKHSQLAEMMTRLTDSKVLRKGLQSQRTGLFLDNSLRKSIEVIKTTGQTK